MSVVRNSTMPPLVAWASILGTRSAATSSGCAARMPNGNLRSSVRGFRRAGGRGGESGHSGGPPPSRGRPGRGYVPGVESSSRSFVKTIPGEQLCTWTVPGVCCLG